jgi:hypothetical protein
MTTAVFSDLPAQAPSASGRRIGMGLSGLAIAFLALDSVGKLIAPATMIAYTPAGLGLPAEPTYYRLLGAILAVATALYALPRTAVFGAVLLTGYLGGAVSANLAAGMPVVGNTLFGVYLGLAVWGGLWLREPRLRALLPLRG